MRARSSMHSPSQFLSTPSARRATYDSVSHPVQVAIFLSTPSARRATKDGTLPSSGFLFLSTPSARRATQFTVQITASSLFLSTPSARRATRPCVALEQGHSISIHALCEEGDAVHRSDHGQQPISIHALCEEGDSSGARPYAASGYFYPRPLRGGRRIEDPHPGLFQPISIHALCEEGDRPEPDPDHGCQAISIHALCEEGDSKNRDKISIFKQIIQHSARI